MLFKDTFYTISSCSTEENTHTYAIKLNASHEIFNGHFPNNPVTPGVVQMEIIKELIGQISSKQVKLTSMASCKFLAILNPNSAPLVDVIIKLSTEESGELKANALIKDENTSYLKMSALYSAN